MDENQPIEQTPQQNPQQQPQQQEQQRPHRRPQQRRPRPQRPRPEEGGQPAPGQAPRQPGETRQHGVPRPPRTPDHYRSGGNRPLLGQHDKISIVVPLYNEDESLRPLMLEIRKAMGNFHNNYEVLFIDDGSTDKSLRIIREICDEDKKFKYISFQKNFGKSAALQVGFENVTGNIVVTMDADLQDDPKEIPNLIKKLAEGHDMVSGWKKKRYDPFIKKISSRFFNSVTRIMSGIKIHDFNCGLKVYRRAVVQNINVYGELHRYIPVLAHWQGFSVAETAVQHHPRKYGKTKFGISRFFKGFIDLLTVVFVTRYIKRPMHLFGFLGALAFLVGFVVNGYLSLEWFRGQPLNNRPMLFLGILLIIVGVQFFSTGLLGEMMVHNFQSTKEYRIKDKRLNKPN